MGLRKNLRGLLTTALIVAPEQTSGVDVLGNILDEFPTNISRVCDGPITYRAPDERSKGVALESERVWEEAANRELFKQVEDNANMFFRVLSESESEAYKKKNPSPRWEYGAYGKFGLSDGTKQEGIIIFTDEMPRTPDLKQTGVHEFGHALLGYTHAPLFNFSIMNGEAGLQLKGLSAWEKAKLQEVLNTCAFN